MSHRLTANKDAILRFFDSENHNPMMDTDEPIIGSKLITPCQEKIPEIMLKTKNNIIHP